MSEEKNVIESTVTNAEEEKKKWAYLELPRAYVTERENDKGNKFYNCTVPMNTVLDGKDIGGYKFIASFANDPIKDWDTKEVDTEAKYYRLSVYNKPVKLTKSEKDEDGKWNIVDTIEVEPKELRKALQKGYREYKKNQEPKEQAVDKKAAQLR